MFLDHDSLNAEKNCTMFDLSQSSDQVSPQKGKSRIEGDEFNEQCEDLEMNNTSYVFNRNNGKIILIFWIFF